MLRVFCPDCDPPLRAVPEGAALPDGAVWLDLCNPTTAEDAAVEAATGMQVPSAEDMAEIETSSRLYVEDGVITITASVATGLITQQPEIVPVSFLLSDRHLVTVRYAEVRSFDRFVAHAERQPMLCTTPAGAMMHLVDAIVDRLADGLEHMGREVDRISAQAFRRAAGSARQQRVSNLALQALLSRLGAAQDALSKARESAVSLNRALSFLLFAAPKDAGVAAQIKTQLRDLAALSDQASFIGSNLTFLLDATLGLISIEQNAVLKIFSVSALVFMPPTLLAGIYGMNFEKMPELQWTLGYPMAIVLMLVAAVAPYAFFRWRGWL